MYYIKVDNEAIFTENNLDDAIADFNKIISKLKENKETKIVYCANIDSTVIITLEVNGKSIILESELEQKLSSNHLYLLPFFIFNKDVLLKLDTDTLKNIINLRPEMLLDILTYDNCLLDPFYVLLKLFNINEEYIYQTYILYLNKTLINSKDATELDIDKITNGFILSEEFVDGDKYKNLFMHYCSLRKLLPFMMTYNKYISLFDLFELTLVC